MGWTSFQDMPGMTPAQILIRELNGTNDNGANWTILDHATKPGEFYGVCRFTAPGADPVFYGVVVLFKRSKKTGEFSYKNMDETCGPYAAKCPIRLIDQLDKLGLPHNTMARDWRDRCRANAKRKPAPAVKPGDIVKFPNIGGEFELIKPAGPRRGWLIKYKNEAVLYRATARQIANCQIVGG